MDGDSGDVYNVMHFGLHFHYTVAYTFHPVAVKRMRMTISFWKLNYENEYQNDVSTIQPKGTFGSVFLSLFVCPQHNSKTNDPKVFKLGTAYTGNDLGISYK